MKTEKHTPGPWQQREVKASRAGITIEGRNGNYIAAVDCDGDRESMHANARLIAAAPDLLEACRLADEKLSSVTQPGESGWDAVMACRAAISQAEGSAK